MSVQFANPKERALQTLLAKDKVRLRNPQAGELLAPVREAENV